MHHTYTSVILWLNVSTDLTASEHANRLNRNTDVYVMPITVHEKENIIQEPSRPRGLGKLCYHLCCCDTLSTVIVLVLWLP